MFHLQNEPLYLWASCAVKHYKLQPQHTHTHPKERYMHMKNLSAPLSMVLDSIKQNSTKQTTTK